MSVPSHVIEGKTIVGWIEGWIVKKSRKIKTAMLEKGGWEWWAQVELAPILRTLPGDPTVQREQPIYNTPKSAVDFLITKGQQHICIELKCESLFKSSEQGRQTVEHTFYKEVNDDIYKLTTDRKAEFSNQPCMVVALCFSDEASTPLKFRMDFHDVIDLGDGWRLHIFIKYL
ncbi:hypothetical protein HC024_12450 [Methylococcaceae bacterium WWC4]|nr:hypothetical protein [Methylococcaceae bacterium WWC4]